jgi:hypothetical protein
MEVCDQLEQAQQYYKVAYDRKQWDAKFQERQWVWLWLLHRPAASMDVKGRGKLGPRFYGPFKILEWVGSVAYKMQLPVGTRIHDVFHIDILKRFPGEPPSAPGTLPPLHHGRTCHRPASVKQSRVARGRVVLLVQWVDRPTSEASWIDAEEFHALYPEFQLEDELLVGGGGRDVMLGVQYTRRRDKQQAGTGEAAPSAGKHGS